MRFKTTIGDCREPDYFEIPEDVIISMPEFCAEAARYGFTEIDLSTEQNGSENIVSVLARHKDNRICFLHWFMLWDTGDDDPVFFELAYSFIDNMRSVTALTVRELYDEYKRDWDETHGSIAWSFIQEMER